MRGCFRRRGRCQADDYFDPMRVPDDAIKKIKAVLTVVDGKVVHDTISGPSGK